MYSPPKLKVFKFLYHSQKVIGSLGKDSPSLKLPAKAYENRPAIPTREFICSAALAVSFKEQEGSYQISEDKNLGIYIYIYLYI